jgi:cobalt-zinc-cadmium efflux system outer membrane protein
LDRASENLKIIRAAYEQGELRLLDVVQEQRKLIEIQAAHTALLRDAALAAAGLEIAVGGSIQ